jgi:hypothetical protein
MRWTMGRTAKSCCECPNTHLTSSLQYLLKDLAQIMLHTMLWIRVGLELGHAPGTKASSMLRLAQSAQ